MYWTVCLPMMNFYNISIIISIVIGLLIILKIRSYDLYEKESIFPMLVAFVIGGITSIIFAVGIYKMLNSIGIDSKSIGSIVGSFLIIGPVEEFSKLVGLIIALQFIKKQ